MVFFGYVSAVWCHLRMLLESKATHERLIDRLSQIYFHMLQNILRHLEN